MVGAQSAPKCSEGAWLWLYKIVSGGILILILVTHLIVNHFAAPKGLLSYADVIKYYQNPLIPLMEILFVTFAVSHSLIGLRSIILDLKPSRSLLAVINWLLTGVGLVAIVYGVWLIERIVSQGS